LDIYAGWLGKVHDAWVFANLSLYAKGKHRELFPPWTERMDGYSVPLVILGDPAYPLANEAICDPLWEKGPFGIKHRIEKTGFLVDKMRVLSDFFLHFMKIQSFFYLYVKFHGRTTFLKWCHTRKKTGVPLSASTCTDLQSN
jgi:hypothetical protein